MRKIVITGAAGFIGSQLAENLGSDYEVHLIDNLSFGYVENLLNKFGKLQKNFHCIDIRSKEIEDILINSDIVIHLAGMSSLPLCQSCPSLAYDINVVGTANVLEMCRLAGISKIIFASTAAVYENNLECNEDLPVHPDLIYACTKQAAEQLCISYSSNYNMDIIIARFSNVYGPHQDIYRMSPPFTSYLIKEALISGKPTLYNNSEAERDYIYIDDVISVFKKIIESSIELKGIYNISSNRGYSVPKMVSIVSKIIQKEIIPLYEDPLTFWDKYPVLWNKIMPLNRNRIQQEVYKNAIIPNTKAMTTFNWIPDITIEQGLSAIVSYFKQQIK